MFSIDGLYRMSLKRERRYQGIVRELLVYVYQAAFLFCFVCKFKIQLVVLENGGS